MNLSKFEHKGISLFRISLLATIMLILVILTFTPPYRITNILPNFIIIIFILSSVYSLAARFEKYEIILIALIAFSFRILFYFICAHNVLPWNDFDLYLNAAFCLHDGDLSLIRNFKDTFPFLQSFICWESIITALFGENFTLFHILDCIYTSAICAEIFFIAGKISKNVGIISSILFAVWPSNIMFSSVISCQHIATLVYLSALYILIRCYEKDIQGKKEYLYHIAVGFLLGLGHLLHSISSVILIAVLLTITFSTIKQRGKNFILKLILCAFLVVISYTIVTTAYDYYAYAKGYRDTFPAEKDLGFKFAIGLNLPDVSGKNNSTIRSEYFSLDRNERKDYVKEIIQTNINMPQQTLKRFADKLKTQWTGYDRPYYYLYGGELANLKESVENDRATPKQIRRYYVLEALEKPFNSFDGTYQGIIIILCLLGCLSSIRRNNSFVYPLINWTLLGYIAAHLLIEHQARYRYFGMPFIFIYAALGIESAVSLLGRIYHISKLKKG